MKQKKRRMELTLKLNQIIDGGFISHLAMDIKNRITGEVYFVTDTVDDWKLWLFDLNL